MTNARPWYKRYPADFITATLNLTLEEKGAYSMVLDLIYDRGGPIPDDSQWIARVCGCSTRRWNQLRGRLIDEGKIVADDGFIDNKRARNQRLSEDKEHEKLSENGAKGAEKSKINRAKVSEKTPEYKTTSFKTNDLTEKGPPKPERHTRAQPETRSQKLDRSVSNDTDQADVVRAFLELRERFWPNESRLPAPTLTLGTQAGQYLEAGATPELCREVFERVMAQSVDKGRSAPTDLRFCWMTMESETIRFKSGVPRETSNPDSTEAHRERGNAAVAAESKRIDAEIGALLAQGDERAKAKVAGLEKKAAGGDTVARDRLIVIRTAAGLGDVETSVEDAGPKDDLLAIPAFLRRDAKPGASAFERVTSSEKEKAHG